MSRLRNPSPHVQTLPASRNSSRDILPLFEYSNVVNSSLDLQFILNTVLRTLMGKMLVSRGVVLLENDEKAYALIAVRGTTPLPDFVPILLERPTRTISLVSKLRDSPLRRSLQLLELELLIPVVSSAHVVGFIALGRRLHGGSYTPTDKKLIQSLVNLSGAAIEKAFIIERMKEANRNLDRKFQELNTLFDLSKEFNIGLDGSRVLRLLTLTLLGQVGAKTYAVCLMESGSVTVKAARLGTEVDILPALPALRALTKPALLEDLFRSKSLRESAAMLTKAEIKAAIPMHIQGEVRGVILLGERLRGGTYSEQDLEFLYALGNLATISIENARLFNDALEKQRMEDELNIAREIQQGLLPERLPRIEGFEIAAANVSSKQVGGDYYDVVQKSSNEFLFAIGDVSGKGAPAALLMANVQAVLRSLGPLTNDLADTTGRMNNLICESVRGSSKFITFFWGNLNTESREFAYVNAGHNPPMIVREGEPVVRLKEGGMLLGVLPTTSPYSAGTVTLRHGDLLVLYTDGVSEAMNKDGVEFSEERLEELVVQYCRSSSEKLLALIQQEIRAHTQDTPQSDDITLLILRAL
jgi:sigma-B regulation protein RsbU (phosphoserine phosphatase)